MRARAAAAAIVLGAVTLAVACDEDPPPPEDAPKTKTSAPNPCAADPKPDFCTAPVLPDAGAGCRFGVADGVCQPPAEACDCEDCKDAALCKERCKDDGKCELADGGEDCTCADCAFKTTACAPKSVGCKTDGKCTPETEDCACPDCAANPSCPCVDDGECVVRLEGCGCDDCAAAPSCAVP